MLKVAGIWCSKICLPQTRLPWDADPPTAPRALDGSWVLGLSGAALRPLFTSTHGTGVVRMDGEDLGDIAATLPHPSFLPRVQVLPPPGLSRVSLSPHAQSTGCRVPRGSLQLTLSTPGAAPRPPLSRCSSSAPCARGFSGGGLTEEAPRNRGMLGAVRTRATVPCPQPRAGPRVCCPSFGSGSRQQPGLGGQRGSVPCPALTERPPQPRVPCPAVR